MSSAPARPSAETLAIVAKSTWPASVAIATLLPKVVQSAPGVHVPQEEAEHERRDALNRRTNWNWLTGALECSVIGMHSCDCSAVYASGGPCEVPRS